MSHSKNWGKDSKDDDSEEDEHDAEFFHLSSSDGNKV